MQEDYELDFKIIDYLIDSILGIDMIVTFFMAVYDDEGLIIDNMSSIRSKYLKGLFTVDILSVIPFEIVGYYFPILNE